MYILIEFIKHIKGIKKYLLGKNNYPVTEFNMLYFIPYSKNFGDELNEYIINKMILNSNIKIHFINLAVTNKFNKNLKSFSLLGSIMHLLPKNTDIIGTGVNPNYPNINKKLKIIYIRGAISKQYLNSKLGYKIDEIIFGDPALLIPRLFPEWLEPLPLSENEIGFIPHFNDIPYIEKIKNANTSINFDCCFPNQSAKIVIDFIRTKKIIISSSLHGIILSEMLGKDVKWMMLEGSLKSESEFKYIEYYNSTNRFNIEYVNTINEAIDSVIPKPEYDDRLLYDLIKNYLSLSN
jgi:pyruvyltransferase